MTENQILNLKRIYWLLAFEFLLVLFLSLFSQPLRELGLTSWLPWKLTAFGKVGRVIFVYHSLAVPFVCALLYLYFFIFDREGKPIAQIATPGYLLTSIGGLGFAYLIKSWILHGIFIFGLSLVFFAGFLFFKELWLELIKQFSWKRLAYFLTTFFILISVIIGATVASYFGNGFQAFLAEDVLRAPHNLFQRAIIAHLHILLALIDVFLLLLIISASKVGKKLEKTLLILTIAGTIVVAFGTWSVMPWERIAHKIINFGSAFLLLPALVMAVYSLKENRLDSPWAGISFYLIAVNFFVTGPGIYVAINLEKFRRLPYSVERTFAVGHWHILATITAVIAFLLLVALSLNGRARQAVGYLATVGSATAFSAAFFYQFYQKTTFITRFIDLGVFLVLVSIVVYFLAVGQVLKNKF